MHFTTTLQRSCLLTIATLLCVNTHAAAQAGHLDTSFANKGIFATTTNQSTASAVAIQGDGKVVIAGSASPSDTQGNVLIRLDTDGTLDSSFGSGGVVNLGNPGEYITFDFFAVAIQPDGKIVAASAAAFPPFDDGVQVARVESNGSLDTAFGSGGFTTVNFIPAGNTGTLALQPDGKILVAAGTRNPSAMVRFTSSGQVDTTFGGTGIVNLVNPRPSQIAVQSNGKILVASGDQPRLVVEPLPSALAGTITRYNSNGTVDRTFGVSGTVASVVAASALALQSDGKIAVAGTLTSKLNVLPKANDIGFGIVRYNANGVIDSSFGSGGVAIADIGVPIAGAFALAIQSNGDLVAAGAVNGLTPTQLTSSFGLTRFTSAGKLDTTFGSGGKVITTVGSGQYSFLTGVAIQSDGKIVAAGTSFFDGSNAYAARYLSQ